MRLAAPIIVSYCATYVLFCKQPWLPAIKPVAFVTVLHKISLVSKKKPRRLVRDVRRHDSERHYYRRRYEISSPINDQDRGLHDRPEASWREEVCHCAST